MEKSIETIANAGEEKKINSCRFCNIGRGTFKVTDGGKGEIYYLCADHKSKNPVDVEAFK